MANKQFTNGMKYSVSGRYMSGSEVTGYHLIGEDGSTQTKVTKEQLILLVDRGLILNCRMQMYQGKPLLRGKNININDLPVMDERTNQLKRIDGAPAVKPKAGSGAVPLGQIYIIGRIAQGRSIVGYVTKDNGGVERNLSRATVIGLAQKKMLANATVQKYGEKSILRGVGVDLDTLPTISADSLRK
jgi:hypothetical protein